MRRTRKDRSFLPCQVGVPLVAVLVGVVCATAALADEIEVVVGEPRIIMREVNYPVLLELGNGSLCRYSSATGWDESPPFPLGQAGVAVKVKVILPFERIWQVPLFPTEISSYEVRYSEGEPPRI